MLFTRLVLSTFVFLFICCDSKEDNKISRIVIDPNSGKTLKLSEIVDSFEIFQPDTSTIVAFISDFIVYKDYVIVLDNQIKKEVQVFDVSGGILFSLKASGDGPGQFRSPSKMRISSSGNELILYCALNKKFLIYNWQGNFINEILVKEFGLIGDFIEKNGEIIVVNVMTIDKSKRLAKIDLKSYHQDKRIIFFKDYPGDFIKIKAAKNHYFFEGQEEGYFFFKDIYSNNIVKMDWNGDYAFDQLQIAENSLDLNSNKIYEPFELSEMALITDAFILGEDISFTKSDLMVDISQGETGVGTVVLGRQSKDIQVISLFENDMDGLFSYTSFTSSGIQRIGIIAMNFDHDMVYKKLNEIDLNIHPFREKLEKLKSPDNENPVFLIYSLK